MVHISNNMAGSDPPRARSLRRRRGADAFAAEMVGGTAPPRGGGRFGRALGLHSADDRLTKARMTSSTAIRFRDVTLGYGRRPAVHHLTAKLAAGSLTAVVGPNGAGKSTLLKGVVGTLETARRPHRIGGRPSGPHRLPAAGRRPRPLLPALRVRSRRMGLWSRAGAFGGIGRRHRAGIEAAIAAVGLTGFERRPIGTLSGGQMQRALFARLLLQDAAVILLDEPFTAIDAKTTADLLDLVRRWHDESRTVVAVLHDLDMVRAHLPPDAALAREPLAWGDDRRGAERRQSSEGAPHDRGARPAREAAARRASSVRGSGVLDAACFTTSSSLPSPSSPSCAGRSSARRRWRSARARRRIFDAAADEPDGRRDGARHPAGRGRGLSRRRPFAAGR